MSDLLSVSDAVSHGVADPRTDDAVRETLAAYGAPLLAYAARRRMSLEVALVKALGLARRDAALFKVLPVVVAKNESALDWAALKEEARRAKLKAELGMLVEMTADLADKPHLKANVSDLRDRRRKVATFFFEPRSNYERRLAEHATPRAARKWKFLMNLGEDTLRSALRKHLA